MSIEIVFSPFNEMVASLHVNCNPVHHPYRRKWAMDVEASLTKEMVDDIRMLGSLTYEWLYLMNIRNEYNLNESSTEEAIEFICSMPDEAFVFYMLGEQYSVESLQGWRKDNRMSPLNQHQKDLLEHPKQWKDRIHQLLYEYNEKIFQRELFRIQPWIKRASATFQQKLDQSSFDALNELHPDVTLIGSTIKVQKGETYRFSLKEYSHLTLQPSTFITPHVMLGVYPGRLCLGLHVAVPETEAWNDEPPTDLVLMFKALGESTRLKILRDIFMHPYSTKQLAEKHDLAEATISSHIKTLQKSGLVTSERKGYYIFYSGNRERMESLRADLSQFISLPLLEQFIYESDLT
jgi:DNA-binding transcriptional ArsR family regulator